MEYPYVSESCLRSSTAQSRCAVHRLAHNQEIRGIFDAVLEYLVKNLYL